MHRIKAVGAVVLVRAVGPLGPHTHDGDAVDALDLDRIALGIFNREILEDRAARGNQKALGPAALVFERENRAIHALPNDRYIRIVERKAVADIIETFRQYDRVTRLCKDQRLLQLLFGAFARKDMIFVTSNGDLAPKNSGCNGNMSNHECTPLCQKRKPIRKDNVKARLTFT